MELATIKEEVSREQALATPRAVEERKTPYEQVSKENADTSAILSDDISRYSFSSRLQAMQTIKGKKGRKLNRFNR